jgi:peptide/nickel transport system substrate-binding protein
MTGGTAGARRVRAITLVVVLMLVAVACGSGDDPGQVAPPAPSDDDSPEATPGDDDPQPTGGEEPTGTPDPEATLRFGAFGAAPQWDPVQGRSTATDQIYYPQVYDQLLTLAPQPEVEVVGMLATSWEMSDDNTELVLELRDDVTFQDGEPFDAEAVKANLDRAKAAEGTLAAAQVATFASVDVEGEHTVRITLESPDPLLPVKLAFNVQSSSMVSPKAIADPDELAANPVGTGMYRLEAFTPERTVYRKADSYWDEEVFAGAPQVVEIHYLTEDNARLNAYRTGAIDIMGVSPAQESAVQQLLQEDPARQLVAYDTGRMVTLYVNTATEALSDVRVRQALSLTLDRPALSEQVLGGACTPSRQPFTPGQPGYVEDAPVGEWNDLDQARALLQEAGATDITLSLLVPEVGYVQQLATVIQAQLAQVGVNAELTVQPGATVRPEFRNGTFDLLILSLTAEPDPKMRLDLSMIGSEAPGGPHELTAELMPEISALRPDDPERTEMLEQISQSLIDEPQHVWLCSDVTRFVADADIAGVHDEMRWSRFSSAMDIRPLQVLSQ